MPNMEHLALTTNLEEICRVCLHGQPNMTNIHANKTNKMFTSCTTIKLEINDELPQLICGECLEKLQHFYAFKTGCLEADHALRQHKQKLKTEQLKLEIMENLQLSQELCIIELEDIKREVEPELVEVDQMDEAPPDEDAEDPLEIPQMENERHLRERFKCVKCNTEYTNVRDLNNHFKSHGNARILIKCPKCNKNFYNYGRLQSHFVAGHIEEGDVACSFCHRVFAGTKELKEHIVLHLRDKPLACEICGQTFKAQFHLNLHVKRHKEEFKYTCNVCDKGFLERRYLVRHMRTHTKVKTFFCDTCSKGFSTKTDLTAHMRIHGGNSKASFKCTTCGLSCWSSSRLHIHMKNHSETEETDERPYICKVCSKGFKMASALIRHILTHPGQEPFKCHICGMKFTKNMHLKSHKMKHWRDKQNGTE